MCDSKVNNAAPQRIEPGGEIFSPPFFMLMKEGDFHATPASGAKSVKNRKAARQSRAAWEVKRNRKMVAYFGIPKKQNQKKEGNKKWQE